MIIREFKYQGVIVNSLAVNLIKLIKIKSYVIYRYQFNDLK